VNSRLATREIEKRVIARKAGSYSLLFRKFASRLEKWPLPAIDDRST
jgi:hypothetical protein